MRSEVEQHVGDGVANLARRGQCACVVAVAPHLADAGDALDRECEANRQAADAAGQFGMAVGFDDRLHVVLLHREMKDAKSVACDRRDRCADGAEQRDRA